MSAVKRLIRVSPDTLYRDLHGEGILLQLETGQYFGLGKVAHRIWQLILEHRELSLVEVTLLSEYPVDPATLSRDLDRFVDQLVEKKLVEIEILPV